MNRFRIRLMALGALVLLAAGLPAFADSERFNATAFNFSGSGKVAVLEIQIDDWTTAEERQEILQAFKTGGSEAVVAILDKADEKGFVRGPDSMAYKMTYAFEFDEADRRVIVLGAGRPVSPRASLESEEHNITLVYLEFAKDKKKGIGQMILGADVEIADGKLQITSAAREPTRFTSVTAAKKKKKK